MQFTQDLSFALRSARQRPGFVIVLVGALALAIGLTTAIFSVFYGVLLKPLPFQDPDRPDPRKAAEAGTHSHQSAGAGRAGIFAKCCLQ